MKNNVKIVLLPLISWLTITLSACVTPPPVEEITPEYMPELTQGDFDKKILRQTGPALVLFHDNTYAPSKRMLALLKSRAKHYYQNIKFYSFIWPLDQNGEQYNLEILPTLVYYHDGRELDRMKGVPSSFDDKSRVSSELDLWLQRTILREPAIFLSGAFIYRYNNTPTLQFSNY